MKETIRILGKKGKGKLLSQLKAANKDWFVAEYRDENIPLLSSLINVVSDSMSPTEFIKELLTDGTWQTFNPEANGFIFYSNANFTMAEIDEIENIIQSYSPFDMNIMMIK